MSAERHDLPGVLRPLTGFDGIADERLHRTNLSIATGSGPVVIGFATDSPKLRDWARGNWAVAPSDAPPAGRLYVCTAPPAAFGLDLPADTTRWWCPGERSLLSFRTDSYSIVKVGVRGVCSAVGGEDTMFAHGCAFRLDHPAGTRGVLVIGSSGAGKTTLVSRLCRTPGGRTRIVNDDWGAVDLATGTVVHTGESRLHMKMRSVLAVHPGFDAPTPMMEGSGDPDDPGTRVLVDPALVYGRDGLAHSARLTHVVFVARDAPPPSADQLMTVLEQGSYSAYYQRSEQFYNGSLILLSEADRERERDRYRRLFKDVEVSWLHNNGTPDDLVDSFMRAVGLG
ncbi:hypothetical protein AB0I81_52845 [Nonomuraea sp. NPDC050404]|uniref:hypothetical protein n=1 Tax=Nonomuraea sp. NPDC050404 TaxID=3155783 RepID=UPI0034115E9E